MRKIAERLLDLREEKHISLEKLSKALQIGKSTLGRWERGECDIPGDGIITLAKFFGVSADYLLGLED